MIPLHETWTNREVITADMMNRRVRDAHRRLYTPPWCRLVGAQQGSDPASGHTPALGSTGWLTNTSGSFFIFHPPEHAPLDGASVDTTDGYMVRTTTGGYVWRVYIPEDGLYQVRFRGSMHMNGNSIYRTLMLLKGTAEDSGTATAPYVVASTAPWKTGASVYAGTLDTVIAARQDDVIYVAGATGVPYFLADDAASTILTVRWAGRYP